MIDKGGLYASLEGYQELVLFFLDNFRTMNLQLSSLELGLFANMLKDQIEDKEPHLASLEHCLESLSTESTHDHQELFNAVKSITTEVQQCFTDTKDYFTDVKLEFVHAHFRRCLNVSNATTQCLAKALMHRIAKSIEIASSRPAPKLQNNTQVTTK